jgi:hypothetical protein
VLAAAAGQQLRIGDALETEGPRNYEDRGGDHRSRQGASAGFVHTGQSHDAAGEPLLFDREAESVNYRAAP